MNIKSDAPLPELEIVADQLQVFRDSNKLNFDDDYQPNGAPSKVSSRIINHVDRPRRTDEEIRQARKRGKRSGVMSF